MAKDKDRTQNPATAHAKSEKSKALKKGKAAVAAQRTERLSRRNPERLQRQVDELKAVREAQGGSLRPRDKAELEKLEREVGAIVKAREAGGLGRGGDRERDGDRHGDRGGGMRGRGRGGDRGRGDRSSMLGKRRRDGDGDGDGENGYRSDETDPDVRGIPMPRDTPPPMPRRPRRFNTDYKREQEDEGQYGAERAPHALPAKPMAQTQTPAQTTYSSAPQLRDLQRESTSKFVPAAVAARLKQRDGMRGGSSLGNETNGGRLLEPEEVDALERGGYLDAKRAADEAGKEAGFTAVARDNGVGVDAGTLEEEEKAFERELRDVEEEEEEEEEEEDDDVDDERTRRDIDREMLEQQGKKDAEKAAEAAAEEAQHHMIVQEALDGVMDGARTAAEKKWRPVEMEEVDDEDL